MFATSDEKGSIDLYDLSKRHDTHCYRRAAEKEDPVNCIRWSADGKKLLSGNAQGVVQLWSVDKEFVQPTEDSLSELAKLEDLTSE